MINEFHFFIYYFKFYIFKKICNILIYPLASFTIFNYSQENETNTYINDNWPHKIPHTKIEFFFYYSINCFLLYFLFIQLAKPLYTQVHKVSKYNIYISRQNLQFNYPVSLIIFYIAFKYTPYINKWTSFYLFSILTFIFLRKIATA